jgi:outer membrane lipopolysaccharide assembly protein LptE/RlpB
MRRLSILALVLVATTLAACGSDRRTTVIAQPGSTVVAPEGSRVVTGD